MFNNLNVTLKKIMVVFLIITLTYANLVLIGSNIVKGLISYAANEVEGNETTENNKETLTVAEEETKEEEAEEETLVLSIENKDIHKTKVSEDGQVEYTGKLKVDVNQITDTTSVTLEDVSKEFYNSDETLNEDVTLKYKTTVINKEDLLKLLGTNGKLVVKDVLTNKVLVELRSNVLTSQELNKKVEQEFEVQEDLGENEEVGFSEERSYVTVTEETVEIEYVLDVTNIKFEITNITIEEQEESNTEPVEGEEPTENEIEPKEIVIENTKIISNIDNVEDLDYLQENIKYIINAEEETANSTIKFKDTITRASLAVDNTEWGVGEANTVKYTITLDTTSEKSELFVNPMFLIEMPESVETINTANSEFIVNNNNGAFIGKRVFVTTVLGKKFVVVTLEGEQTAETIANGDTTIDLTLELLVKETAIQGNETTKLYYQNDTVTAYESGKGFDTAEVTVSMIMESEPKDEIEENTEISLSLISSVDEIIQVGEEFIYEVSITNESGEEKQNLQLTCTLPEGISIVNILEFVDFGDGIEEESEYSFDEATRILTINIDKLGESFYKVIYDEETGITDYSCIGLGYKIIVKADDLPEDTYSKEIKNSMTLLEGDKILAKSPEVVNTVSDVFLKVEIDELPEKINEEEEFVLGVKVINKGLISATGVDINIDMPEEISLSKYKLTTLLEDEQKEMLTEGTVSGDFKMDNLIIQKNTMNYFQLIGSVKDIKETKLITITGTVGEEQFSWTIEVANTQEGTLDPEEPENPEQPTNPEDPENPENSEQPTNPEDPENPTNPEQPTDPENPEDPENPDDETKPGDTDNPTDTENKTEGFDLSLNQYLNKVTVTNEKGTTVYEYKDTSFAKVEIHSKQMNGSKVTLEYNILVKNEGTIPGYARKIVDYIPSDLTFNQELNPNWYLGDDGNVYSVELIDKLLEPGETAELKIILEKQMTNDNVGTVTNLVEIYEASNDKNVEDINSTPADRLEGQNDISKVEVMVVTSTGTIILYTTLVIAVITIIGFGFYRIKKVTLNKKGGC